MSSSESDNSGAQGRSELEARGCRLLFSRGFTVEQISKIYQEVRSKQSLREYRKRDIINARELNEAFIPTHTFVNQFVNEIQTVYLQKRGKSPDYARKVYFDRDKATEQLLEYLNLPKDTHDENISTSLEDESKRDMLLDWVLDEAIYYLKRT